MGIQINAKHANKTMGKQKMDVPNVWTNFVLIVWMITKFAVNVQQATNLTIKESVRSTV